VSTRCIELSEDDVIEIHEALINHAHKYEAVTRAHVNDTTKRICAERAAKLRSLALRLMAAINRATK
jgi:hypothetical protein